MNLLQKALPHGWHGFSRLLLDSAPAGQESRLKRRSRVEEVTRYLCTVCDEVHEKRSEAEACCAPAVAGANSCPICNGNAVSPRHAADCCLWKDLDAPTRWAVADAVEAGSTWAEELTKLAAQRLQN